MKINRVLVFIAPALLVFGFAVCRADLIPVFATYKNTPENTANIVSVASMKLGDPNLESLLRLEDTSPAPSDSPFTINYLSGNLAEVSWNLTGTGTELSAIYVFGGSNGANLYKITDPVTMIIGSAVVHAPVTGNSGHYAGISHTLFLGAPVAVAVPEPSSIALLSVGAGILLRKLRKRGG